MLYVCLLYNFKTLLAYVWRAEFENYATSKPQKKQ